MVQSKQSYSGCGLGSSYTDKIVELVQAESGQGLFGAKITGFGVDGTVALLSENSPRAQVAYKHVVECCTLTKTDPYTFENSLAGYDTFGIEHIRIYK